MNDNKKEVLVSMKHVNIGFKSGTKVRVVIDDLNLDVYKGEILGLVGESGSGKTTIGRSIIRIVPTLSGTILYKGIKINGKIPHKLDRNLKTKIQMIYQDPSASLNDRANIDYIVSEGIRAYHMYDNETDRLKKVNDIMIKVGLRPEHLKRFPHEFSGGQRQRIGIARALIMNPELLICDEPISALDVSIRAQIINLLNDLKNELNLSIIFIAHDLSVVKYFCDRICVMYFGKVVEEASSDELFKNPLHPYTKSLLSAIPRPDPKTEKKRQRIKYNPQVDHDYSKQAPTFREIKKGHFVLCNDIEFNKYKQEII